MCLRTALRAVYCIKLRPHRDTSGPRRACERTWMLTAFLLSILTNHFKTAAISLSLQDAMCFIQCSKMDRYSTPEETETHHYFVPEPGTLCRPSCIRNQRGVYRLELYGIQELLGEDNRWGVHAQDFLVNSYKHWKLYRYRADYMWPTMDQLVTGDSANTSTGASLPVCYSPVSLNTPLPCICGDFYGNETIPFFENMNLASWRGSDGGQMIPEACQYSFDRSESMIGAVQRSLTWCTLGWHWPMKKEHVWPYSHDFHIGKDPQCDKLLQETRDFSSKLGPNGLEEIDGPERLDCHICWKTDVGHDYRKGLRHKVYAVGDDDYSHRKSKFSFERLCKIRRKKSKWCSKELNS